MPPEPAPEPVVACSRLTYDPDYPAYKRDRGRNDEYGCTPGCGECYLGLSCLGGVPWADQPNPNIIYYAKNSGSCMLRRPSPLPPPPPDLTACFHHRCQSDDDCQGPRTCSGNGWCQGSAKGTCCAQGTKGMECFDEDCNSCRCDHDPNQIDPCSWPTGTTDALKLSLTSFSVITSTHTPVWKAGEPGADQFWCEQLCRATDCSRIQLDVVNEGRCGAHSSSGSAKCSANGGSPCCSDMGWCGSGLDWCGLHGKGKQPAYSFGQGGCDVLEYDVDSMRSQNMRVCKEYACDAGDPQLVHAPQMQIKAGLKVENDRILCDSGLF
mmetsp:Transcript_10307/g.17301  ORF Transcript_10307/g.17301 Transcript_10307/m.17301 type:complete len:323 (+) Transcript_10307:1-969(+)